MRAFLSFLVLLCVSSVGAAAKKNVLLIICDDLNGYLECFGGHPQAKTPNIARLADSGVVFQQAHCTIPICAPSRSSFLTGLYPHTPLKDNTIIVFTSDHGWGMGEKDYVYKSNEGVR